MSWWFVARAPYRLLGACLLVPCVACSSAAVQVEEIDSNARFVVYERDDRQDIWEVSDAAVRDFALQSSVAIARPNQVQLDSTGNLQLTMQTLAARGNVCSGEHFSSQPS